MTNTVQPNKGFQESYIVDITHNYPCGYSNPLNIDIVPSCLKGSDPDLMLKRVNFINTYKEQRAILCNDTTLLKIAVWTATVAALFLTAVAVTAVVVWSAAPMAIVVTGGISVTITGLLITVAAHLSLFASLVRKCAKLTYLHIEVLNQFIQQEGIKLLGENNLNYDSYLNNYGERDDIIPKSLKGFDSNKLSKRLDFIKRVEDRRFVNYKKSNYRIMASIIPFAGIPFLTVLGVLAIVSVAPMMIMIAGSLAVAGMSVILLLLAGQYAICISPLKDETSYLHLTVLQEMQQKDNEGIKIQGEIDPICDNYIPIYQDDTDIIPDYLKGSDKIKERLEFIETYRKRYKSLQQKQFLLLIGSFVVCLGMLALTTFAITAIALCVSSKAIIATSGLLIGSTGLTASIGATFFINSVYKKYRKCNLHTIMRREFQKNRVPSEEVAVLTSSLADRS